MGIAVFCGQQRRVEDSWCHPGRTEEQQSVGHTDGPPRNWKGIGIAMVVILAVMSLVILSVILLTPDETHLLLRSHLTMEDLESEDFKVHDPSVAWLNGKGPRCHPESATFLSLIMASCCLCGLLCQVYVFEGDIYYRPSVSSRPLRLTATEPEENVVNGLSDWTYEEEILLAYPAHWWSLDGARLAYLSINNSATPVMEIPHFLGGLYPSNVLFPYPKAGSSIPSASLFVVNLYGPAHTLEMIPPDSLRARDSYISMVTWISSTRLAVRWLNRAQNQSVVCVCEATTGACSEVSGHQLFHISNLNRRGCSIHWDVTVLCPECVDVLLFPSVDLDGVFQRQCISCNLIDGCRFFRAVFSPNQTHFTLYCLGPGIPKVTVHSTKDPSRYVLLEDNSPLSKALEDKRLPETLFRTLPADNHGETNKLYIQTYFVDGIPGGQSVTEEFALDWPQVLSSMHSVALAWVDGRSGVGRGQKTAAVDPRKIGSLRVKDYLGVVELLMQLPYIDDRRMALYGKAFGGYLTLKMLAATDKLFQCTAAVAPITDFRLYSAAFSERYLGLPAKEEHAYSTASVLEEVNKLKDENFLILHGTADGEVHFQHSAELLSRLVKVEANYSLQLYPDEGHVLREPRSVQHFQRTVVNYLQTCLKHSALLDLEEDDEEEDD
uniref:Dipeptidyl-peptidase 6b n=1 Tax=Salarias fasciatus TaxID=181472 RepID=A0A672JJJ0_SALFA